MEVLRKIMKTTEKLLNTSNNTRKKFAKHFLVAVHSEISFVGTSIQSVMVAEESLKNFFLSKGFETSRTMVEQELSMTSTPNEPPTVLHKDNPIGLVFSSEKPRREIQVLDTRIVFSDFNYTGFEQFSALFKEICSGILTFMPQADVKKVGLRKIDSIIINPVNSYQDACVIFNPALFASLRSGLIKEGTLNAHAEISVIEKGSNLCVMRAQMKKQSSPLSYEACLDFDFVDMTPTTIDQVFTKTLPELNDNHFELFMWAALMS